MQVLAENTLKPNNKFVINQNDVSGMIVVVFVKIQCNLVVNGMLLQYLLPKT
jgi:hypothetical protein